MAYSGVISPITPPRASAGRGDLFMPSLQSYYWTARSMVNPFLLQILLLKRISHLAVRVGFEPTGPLRGKRFSRPSRYDHFGTSPFLLLQSFMPIHRFNFAHGLAIPHSKGPMMNFWHTQIWRITNCLIITQVKSQMFITLSISLPLLP